MISIFNATLTVITREKRVRDIDAYEGWATFKDCIIIEFYRENLSGTGIYWPSILENR